MKTLHLTLHSYFFNEILEGRKTHEYREITPFWRSRLFHRDGTPKFFDVVKFRNGYAPDAPAMVVEFRGVTETDYYDIALGAIVETQNLHNLNVKSPPGYTSATAREFEPGDLLYDYNQVSDHLERFL